MIQEHLEESKRLLIKLADEILLNEDDLKANDEPFSSLTQKISNLIIFDHLRDLMNERLEDLEKYTSDDEELESYKNELITFGIKLGRERI